MGKTTELNPFDFSRPASAEDLIDRDHELELLVRLAEGSSNSRLTAPRRYGKTTLLKRVRHEAETRGMNTVYVNFYGLLSVTEAADRIEDAYRKSLHGTVRNLAVGIIRTFRPTAKIPKTGLRVEPTLETEIGRRLAWLLDLPVKIMEKTGSSTLVVFDEFQDILLTKPALDGLIRSRLEQHEAEAGYVFAGSHPGMMKRLFGDRARPFYGQARAVRLEPLPEDALAEYVADRFTSSGRDIADVLDLFLATVRGHPQRAMLLAHFLWERTPPGAKSDYTAWQAGLEDVYLELRDEFNSVWDGLADAERRTLAAIASGPRLLLKKQVLEGLALARSTARDARDRLIDAGHVRADGEELEIIDPLLALWVARGRQGLTDLAGDDPEG
ncbi:MAG TPA: hypothetical protein VFM94_01275 [Solirubrobacterales bacterium]|nr:hypothetical protein [Solirubrobacterales bacterium]